MYQDKHPIIIFASCSWEGREEQATALGAATGPPEAILHSCNNLCHSMTIVVEASCKDFFLCCREQSRGEVGKLIVIQLLVPCSMC